MQFFASAASQYQAWQREADKLSMKDLQGIFEVSGIMLAIVAAVSFQSFF